MNLVGRFARRWWLVLAVVAIWQLVSALGAVNPLLVPAPAQLLGRLGEEPAKFLLPLLHTVGTAAIGLALGVGAGLVVASCVWASPFARNVITPLAVVIRSVPFVALIPVLSRLIGYSDRSAWLICGLVSFFPTFVLVSSGLRDIPANGDDLFSVNGASRWAHYRRLALPACLPALATSIRVAAASSIAAALVAEFLMGTPGLALVLTEGLDSFDIPAVWVGSACAAAVGIAAYLLAGWLETTVVKRFT
ncbi:ABC transporter permease [Amycolatopsis jejuensis]|uniref:ABC transporter permease n=1 Tax=Amycolatopsis jejuensis TaxID=330084 RepID=UPI00068B2E91|nr:ABC transporter permease subunit [Amycolatopsis jejuensis]